MTVDSAFGHSRMHQDPEILSEQARITADTSYSSAFLKELLSEVLPSSELLEFFKERIKAYDEQEKIFKYRLDKYFKICSDRRLLEKEVLKRGEQIRQLQKALSDLNGYVFAQKKEWLKLLNENEMLRLKERKLHLKIEQLADITADTDLYNQMVYIFKDYLKLYICQKTVPSGNHKEQTYVKRVAEENNLDVYRSFQNQIREINILKDEVIIVQRQLERQIELSQKELEAKAEEYHLCFEEAKAQNERDKAQIESLCNRLKETEKLLESSEHHNLELQQKMRKSEIMGRVEKEFLVNSVEKVIDHVSSSDDIVSVIVQIRRALFSTPISIRQKEFTQNKFTETDRSFDASSKTVNNLTLRDYAQNSKVHPSKMQHTVSKETVTISPAKKVKHGATVPKSTVISKDRELLNMYRTRYKSLEEKLKEMEGQHQTIVENYEMKIKSLSERCQRETARLKKLEKMRKLEIEGFQTDLKHLSQKLRTIEKELMKTVLLLEQRNNDADLVKEIKRNTQQSLRQSNEMRRLKAKLFLSYWLFLVINLFDSMNSRNYSHVRRGHK